MWWKCDGGFSLSISGSFPSDSGDAISLTVTEGEAHIPAADIYLYTDAVLVI